MDDKDLAKFIYDGIYSSVKKILTDAYKNNKLDKGQYIVVSKTGALGSAYYTGKKWRTQVEQIEYVLDVDIGDGINEYKWKYLKLCLSFYKKDFIFCAIGLLLICTLIAIPLFLS